MNFYSLFYWMSVADAIKDTFEVIAIIFTVALVASIIGYFVSTNTLSEKLAYNIAEKENREANVWKVWVKAWRNAFIVSFIIALISTIFTVFVPSKKDTLIIIAGGAVGNFITQDTTSKKIPHEIMDLLSEKIKAEIKDTKLNLIPEAIKDTLKTKTKAQLIQMLKEQALAKDTN